MPNVLMLAFGKWGAAKHLARVPSVHGWLERNHGTTNSHLQRCILRIVRSTPYFQPQYLLWWDSCSDRLGARDNRDTSLQSDKYTPLELGSPSVSWFITKSQNRFKNKPTLKQAARHPRCSKNPKKGHTNLGSRILNPVHPWRRTSSDDYRSQQLSLSCYL